MARPQKPWYRKSRQSWFVEVAVKQHNLGPDKEEAHRRFHELMAAQPVAASGSVAELLDAFIVYCEETKAPTLVPMVPNNISPGIPQGLPPQP